MGWRLKNRSPPPMLLAAAPTIPAERRKKEARGASTDSQEIDMLNYVVLASFTEQGIRNVKETTKRADLARETAGKFGVKMREIYWTQGQYDIVTLCEAQDEASIAAFGLALSSAGNIRFETLRAFSRDEMNGILSKLP
jgi:uncharacterized protein with GYD domain